jgi:glycosyltransferase involved in cell wall biosynthesis
VGDEEMKICIVHGYLLSGTGSNLYVANLARELTAAGHEVVIVCQEPHPESLDLENIRVVRPDLEGKLLVYVYDEYEGFHTVKTLQEASEEEVEDYVQKNVSALKAVIDDFKPDWIQTNHAVLQPYIAKLASEGTGVPYIATLHGSALNFSVKERASLHRYAMEGLSGASAVVAVSGHCAHDMEEYLKSRGEKLRPELRVIPAGVDTDIFKPHDGKRTDLLGPLKDAVSRRLELMPGGQSAKEKERFREDLRTAGADAGLADLFKRYAGRFNARHTDRDAIDTIESVDWGRDKVVLFVGKYLWTKGAQLIISAAPLVLREFPDARFILTGFGESKQILMALASALAEGRSDLFEYLLERHGELDPGSVAHTPPVETEFLEGLRKSGSHESYFDAAKSAQLTARIRFTGFLSHEELRYLLPMADAFAAPSIFPEAFGQVAAEAMASGVYPIVTYGSGFREVFDELESKLGDDAPHMRKLAIDAGLVTSLAKDIRAVLTCRTTAGKGFKRRLSGLAGDLYGWGMIADRYVQLAKDL